MATGDRILPLCELLMGAAHADAELGDAEQAEIRALLEELSGGLTPEVEAHLAAFDPEAFDVFASAAPFKSDPEEERRKILLLASAVTEADDVHDLAEDDYLRALAGALGLPNAALAGLTVDVEIEVLRASFTAVRKAPPPIPTKRA